MPTTRSLAVILFALPCVIHALPPIPVDAQAELTLTYVLKTRVVAGEFNDLTVNDRVATLRCPLTAGDVMPSSMFSESPEMKAAQAELGAAAEAQVSAAAESGAVGGMQAMQQKMEACLAAGRGDQACAMEMMAAMQADPSMMEQMQAATAPLQGAMDAATASVEQAAGAGWQLWYNEGCSGRLTVNDRYEYHDPTVVDQPAPITTTGTVKIDTSDTLVTVETDLARGETRYMLVAPQAEGFTQSGKGAVSASVGAGTVVAGPFPGPAQSGSQTWPMQGGSYKVEWVFRRLQ